MFKYIFVFIVVSNSFSQYITIKVGMGSSFHFDQGNSSDQNDVYEIDKREKPKMFDSGKSMALTAMFNFVNDDQSQTMGHFQVGFAFSQEKTRSKAIILDFLGNGDDFIINTFAPFIGYSFYLPGGYSFGNYYFNMGYSYSHYEGLNTDNYIFFKTDYLPSKSIYLNSGFSINIYKDIGLDYSISYYKARIIPKNLYAPINTAYTQSKLAQGIISDDYFTMRLALLYTL